MSVAIVGAGPAGLVSAKIAIDNGFDVTVFEKQSDLGGIWNPEGGGAYKNAFLQNSPLTFSYASYRPEWVKGFQGLENVNRYLNEFADINDIRGNINFESDVKKIKKNMNAWSIEYRQSNKKKQLNADNVIISIGEHWVPKRNIIKGLKYFQGDVITSREYEKSDCYKNRKVLVVGGGVSGADIASDLVASASYIDWSVRKLGLYLPRMFSDEYNDEWFSYMGRLAALNMPYSDFIALLKSEMPEYMKAYEKSELLPQMTTINAIHVNDNIIPHVASGNINAVSEVSHINSDGNIIYLDGTSDQYNSIIICGGYERPDYSFINAFQHCELYEHFFYYKDPTLTVLSPPVDTVGFGASFPYFEMVAKWIMATFKGKVSLPTTEEMGAWCSKHMTKLDNKRFYDSWLETIRIGLFAEEIPDPKKDFKNYWKIVSSKPDPSLFNNLPSEPIAGTKDNHLDLFSYKVRMLASINSNDKRHLLNDSQISYEEFVASTLVKQSDEIKPGLDYNQEYVLR